MLFEFYCPLWGNEAMPFDEFCSLVKSAGYDGVELPFPEEEAERVFKLRVLEDSGLTFIAQHYETFEPDFSAHTEEFRQRLELLVSTGPEFVSSQSGRDWFELDQNLQLIDLADEVSTRTAVPILHETHRSKMMFAAHIARRIIEKRPAVRLTLDISHWCSVAETMLGDQREAVELALMHTNHIHARVGFEEGPQVPDPFAPEWEYALKRHLEWWDTVAEEAERAGRDRLSLTCECGPFPYMPATPYSCKPVADQWGVNLRMLEYLRNRYSG